MKKNKWLVAAAAAVLSLSVTSCTNLRYNASPVMSEEQEKVRLRFISSWGGVDSKAETLQEIFVRFTNENPNIEIINESLFGEDFLPKIKTDFASGNNPDVFGIWPGSDIRALIQAGKVADLTGLMEENPEWLRLFKSSMLKYTTYDGKLYGLPFEIIFEALFINRDLFEKYNVPIPATFEELKDAVKIFRENDIVPIAYNSLAEGTYLYQNMVALLAGKEIAENPLHPEFGNYYKKAMSYMQELYRIGAFPDDAFTMTNHERNTMFLEKKAAMIVQGSWFIGNIPPDDETVDIVYFPYFSNGNAPPKTLIYGLGNGCFYISSETYNDDTKRDAAVSLLRFLTSKETAAEFARQTGMISCVDIRDYSIDYNALTGKAQILVNNSRQFIGPPDHFIDRTVWEEVIVPGIPYVLEGKMEIDELYDKAVKAGLLSN
ncbi:ABC transporter substrate-binding protein [Thermoclostridium stercorarium subsp. thermolacticum DSM 2910]|nr:extracellular solute-binding protein [Thermoclostridium stercorarium]AGI40558.1 ABC transporter permease subunit [Thermoclostridium stercorarium subsp. stercorarium DSM 8532]ANW99835.1 ABC transporter substrate-binding protein [Thermoclostridium stercorarium subsp. thermolacticum DSM 2910]ANX02461.1 ABC transporter substrate-binding protein [Thermoclostridium stercorarium subsp. leptospartum DSM 9219]